MQKHVLLKYRSEVGPLTYSYSPRAQTLLFMFSSANGLMVVSIVETCQEFKKPSLTKNNLLVLSEFSFKHGYRRKI